MRTVLVIMLGICCALSYAQPVPLEVVVGKQNYWYQHVFVKEHPRQARIGFFHVSSLYAFYEREKVDELMSQSYATYDLVKGVSAAVGTFYATGPGFTPSLAIQFFKQHNDLTLMAVPRIDLKKSGAHEMMAFIQYRPQLFRTVRLYSRIQAMSSFTKSVHNRSYQTFRVGLHVNNVQFGFAYSADEYGSEKTTRHNAGIFLRTEL